MRTVTHPQTRRETAEALALLTAPAPLLTRKEAAAALKVSIRKLDLLIETGDIPVVRMGRTVRVRPSAIEYFIEARETRQPAKRKGGAK